MNKNPRRSLLKKLMASVLGLAATGTAARAATNVNEQTEKT